MYTYGMQYDFMPKFCYKHSNFENHWFYIENEANYKIESNNLKENDKH